MPSCALIGCNVGQDCGEAGERSRESLTIRYDDEQGCEATAFRVSAAYAKVMIGWRTVARETDEVKSGGLLYLAVLD